MCYILKADLSTSVRPACRQPGLCSFNKLEDTKAKKKSRLLAWKKLILGFRFYCTSTKKTFMCILYENLLLWCESHSQNFSALYYSMLAVLYSQQIIWTKLQNFSHYLSRRHYLLNKNNTCYPWATACMILCLMIISIHIAPKQLYPENELQYLETNFISLYLNQLCISQMLPPIWSAFMYFNSRLHSVGVCRISRSLNMTTKETSSINIESKLTRLKQNRIKILELLAFYSCFRKVFFSFMQLPCSSR